MTPSEVEQKYLSRLRTVGSLLLLSAETALDLLDDCASGPVRLLGVEAFRLFENGGVQPATEFSNISFGKVPKGPAESRSEFTRRQRKPYDRGASFLETTKALIRRGSASGYTWYEVSLEDPDTNELLFFRCADASGSPSGESRCGGRPT